MRECLECGEPFAPRAHNQKYCKPECCRKATNRKIMENYYINKRRLAGEKRPCAECGAPLSRYNEGVICEACENDQDEKEYIDILKGIKVNASRGNKKKKAR
jgi:hypothetical protein